MLITNIPILFLKWNVSFFFLSIHRFLLKMFINFYRRVIKSIIYSFFLVSAIASIISNGFQKENEFRKKNWKEISLQPLLFEWFKSVAIVKCVQSAVYIDLLVSAETSWLFPFYAVVDSIFSLFARVPKHQFIIIDQWIQVAFQLLHFSFIHISNECSFWMPILLLCSYQRNGVEQSRTTIVNDIMETAKKPNTTLWMTFVFMMQKVMP